MGKMGKIQCRTPIRPMSLASLAGINRQKDRAAGVRSRPRLDAVGRLHFSPTDKVGGDRDALFRNGRFVRGRAAVVSLETCWLTDGSVIRVPPSATVKAAVAGNTGRKLRWYSPGRK